MPAVADEQRVIRGVGGGRELGRRRPGFAVVGRGHLLDGGNLAVEFLPHQPDGSATCQEVRSCRPPAGVGDRHRCREMLAVIQGSGIEQALTRLARGEPRRVNNARLADGEARPVMRAGLDPPIVDADPTRLPGVSAPAKTSTA